jgi:DNA-binding transcriptional LysR family regulator
MLTAAADIPMASVDLEELRCFYYAALHGSFTAAASQLGTGQPTVSRRIKQLETRLGKKLFERRRRGAQPTEDGRVLLNLLGDVVERMDRLPRDFLEQSTRAVAPEVRIAGGQELLLDLVGPALRAFRAQHPDIRIVVSSGIRERVQAQVLEGTVDFGIASRFGLPIGLRFREILQDRLVLITAPGHDLDRRGPVRLGEVSPYPVLLPDRKSSTRQVIEQAFREQGLPVQAAMELERWQVIKAFVGMGFGVAVVPRFVARGGGGLAVRKIATPLPTLSYGVLTRHGGYLSPAARELVDTLVSWRVTH